VTPPNKKPVRIIERPPEIEPHNGHIAEISASAPESKRALWLRLLWEQRRLLWRATAVGFVLALLLALLLPIRYESKARLMPPEQTSGSGLAMLAALAGRGSGSGAGGVGGALGSMGGVAGDLLGLKSSGALFVDMLNGATIQDDVINKFNLRKSYHDRYWEDARRDLAKFTDIKEDRKSGVITIAVTDRDPHRAEEIAQAYVDALNGLVAQVSTSSARRERMFLEGRLKTVKQNLDDASKEFSEFASKNGTLNLPDQAKAMVESEAGLEGQLVAAQSELEGLKQIYRDSNIRVRSLNARVGALKSQIEAMSGNKADLGSDQSGIAGDFPSIRKLPLVGVRWANLYRESKIQETVYELLTQEYELAKIQEAKEIPTVNLLDPPLVPERKSFPPRTLIVLLGTMFAFCVGATVIIGSELWKQDQSQEKQLVREIWTHILPRDAKSRLLAHRAWNKLSGRNGNHRSD
jgi:capsule polysaccharide export protein KpsE/RkpR